MLGEAILDLLFDVAPDGQLGLAVQKGQLLQLLDAQTERGLGLGVGENPKTSQNPASPVHALLGGFY